VYLLSIFFSGPPLTTWQHLLCTRGYTNTEFWPKVDEELANLCAGGSGDLVTCVIALSLTLCFIKSAHLLLSVLQIIYKDDGQTHGDPTKSKHKTGDGVGQGSPSWLHNLSSLVPHIQRFSRQQGMERKRCDKDRRVGIERYVIRNRLRSSSRGEGIVE
jgi:hypothetical protein